MKKNWDKTFLEVAKGMAEHSTCTRVQVGAVLTKDRRIISCGYNGVPSKQEECKDYFFRIWNNSSSAENGYISAFGFNWLINKYVFPTFEDFLKSDVFYKMHRTFSIDNELHAEQNAIGYAARNGIETNGSTIYLTISPCKQCAKLMIAAGVKRIVYAEKYNRSEDDGIPLLKQNNVECELYGTM